MTDEPIGRPEPELPNVDLEPEEHADDATSDPTRPDEEGRTYVPPVDPPVAGSEDGQPHIAAGFGRDVDADPYDADHHRAAGLGDDEMSERIRERLAADSLGSEYADRLAIVTVGSTAVVEGVVEDLDVQDHILGLVAAVPGVEDVRDRLLPE